VATTKKASKSTVSVEHPKALIIAEKPSVANDIAKALGGFTKHDEYFENDAFLISSAVGHLLEIAAQMNTKLSVASGHLLICQ